MIVNSKYNLLRRPGKRNVCGTILLYEDGTEYQIQMSGAQVIFRYPIVGRVIFRQPLDQPWEDTTIIIESMVRFLILIILNYVYTKYYTSIMRINIF